MLRSRGRLRSAGRSCGAARFPADRPRTSAGPRAEEARGVAGRRTRPRARREPPCRRVNNQLLERSTLGSTERASPEIHALRSRAEIILSRHVRPIVMTPEADGPNRSYRATEAFNLSACLPALFATKPAGKSGCALPRSHCRNLGHSADDRSHPVLLHRNRHSAVAGSRLPTTGARCQPTIRCYLRDGRCLIR
jgi:hypothetical protein